MPSFVRFFQYPVPLDERERWLRYLVQSYQTTMNDLGVETWIMHGTLIGWYRNRKILPFDHDGDVQMTEESLSWLADHHNATIHAFRSHERTYLLDINPQHVKDSLEDVNNPVDGRWIDTSNGMWLDITSVRPHPGPAEQEEPVLRTKFGHQYAIGDIYPLQKTDFEGVPTLVPAKAEELLVRQYGEGILTQTAYKGYRWDPKTKLWVKDQA
ncbi:LicD family-domain-containing protein [Apodospora peruviana]|uniref:LicD family-domain-containing protein n=1 Tax=Apodospora peruviana TaxID=516989 RepID=A0AAE0HVF8_9PEZI|nr:LicD family-domain-containing protein [Apodospora peruviana]